MPSSAAAATFRTLVISSTVLELPDLWHHYWALGRCVRPSTWEFYLSGFLQQCKQEIQMRNTLCPSPCSGQWQKGIERRCCWSCTYQRASPRTVSVHIIDNRRCKVCYTFLFPLLCCTNCCKFETANSYYFRKLCSMLNLRKSKLFYNTAVE